MSELNTRTLSSRDIRRVFLLSEIPLFASLTAEQLLPLCDIVSEEQHEAGVLLFEQGDPGLALYLIVEGEVAIERDGVEIARLARRACVGEMAVIDDAPRSASARVLQPAKLLRLDQDAFEGLIEVYPALSRAVIAVLAERLR